MQHPCRKRPRPSLGGGVQALSTIEAIQSITVNPDTDASSEGAPEWLVTNGLGGYASGTVTGTASRRFHGYLVAALPAPRGRTMMLNQLDVIMVTDGERVRLTKQPDPAGVGESRAKLLDFRLELGLPVWRFEHQGHVIAKRIVMPQSTEHRFDHVRTAERERHITTLDDPVDSIPPS